MMISSVVLLFSFLLLTSVPVTLAWPWGAGACPAHQPAVGGSHLSKAGETYVTGSLPLGNFSVLLDGKELSTHTAVNFTAGANHILTLTVTQPGSTYTGLLFRLGGGNVNTTSALQVPQDDNELQLAELFCIVEQGVGGVTHTNSTDKSLSSMILRLDEDATNLHLDVTVVVQNDELGSIWFYSAYTLNAVGAMISTHASNNDASNSTSSSSSDVITDTSVNDSKSTPSIGFVIGCVLLGIVTVGSLVNIFAVKTRVIREHQQQEEDSNKKPGTLTRNDTVLTFSNQSESGKSDV